VDLNLSGFQNLSVNFVKNSIFRHALMHLYENLSDQKDKSEKLRDGVVSFGTIIIILKSE
jgi:hypothetical protein